MQTTHCRHFNGILGPGMRKDHKPCLAGENFRDYAEKHDRGLHLACHSEGTKTCPKFSAWTGDEVAADEAMWKAHMEKTLNARAAIVHAIEAGAANEGTIACPACHAGQLRYNRTDYNGHIWAKCSTDDCVAFME